MASADPAAVGWAVRVHPLAMILALLVAAPLFGLLGMVLTVPVAAAVKIRAGHWWASRTLRTEQQLGAGSGPSQASNGDPLPRTLLCGVKSWLALEQSVELTGDVADQAAFDLSVGLALSPAAVGVSAGCWVGS